MADQETNRSNNIRHASFGNNKNPKELLQQIMDMDDLAEVVVVYTRKDEEENTSCNWSAQSYANLAFSVKVLDQYVNEEIFGEHF